MDDKKEASVKKDRKLGDEWNEWEVESHEAEIDERYSTFAGLAAAVTGTVAALIPAGWYLVRPRVEQFSPGISDLLGIIIWSITGFLFLLVVTEGISLLWLRKSFLPYRCTEKLLLMLLPKTVWLGAKLGISRDRVGNSFIKLHNLAVRSYADKLDPERILVLLPRCLKKETRAQIISRINDDIFRILTVAGGEEARKAIVQYRPNFILALACERDLMSGLRDVADKIPVLAIANKRPEGPCKNTVISLGDLDEALGFITERKKKVQT